MPPKKNMSFEERLRRLQEVVTALESGGASARDGELSLEDSVRLYKEGLELSRACRDQLEKVRNEVRLLTEDGSLEPFAPANTQTRAEDEDVLEDEE